MKMSHGSNWQIEFQFAFSDSNGSIGQTVISDHRHSLSVEWTYGQNIKVYIGWKYDSC
jgi:hypothetical protein